MAPIVSLSLNQAYIFRIVKKLKNRETDEERGQVVKTNTFQFSAPKYHLDLKIKNSFIIKQQLLP